MRDSDTHDRKENRDLNDRSLQDNCDLGAHAKGKDLGCQENSCDPDAHTQGPDLDLDGVYQLFPQSRVLREKKDCHCYIYHEVERESGEEIGGRERERRNREEPEKGEEKEKGEIGENQSEKGKIKRKEIQRRTQ